MTTALKNVAKKSSVAENLVNNKEYANKYDLSKFKNIRHRNNVTDLI